MGMFIAIEGGDGSGKGTQTKLLVEHYRSKGMDVLELDFPQYGTSSALYVQRYLNGEYGVADEVPADLASLPYAIDRFTMKDTLAAHLAKPNSVAIANRYVASNMAHQGTKIRDPEKRKQFYDEIQHLEYDLLGIAKPDINIVLIIPADLSQTNIDKKAARDYTKKKRDIHEADLNHLERAKANYEELVTLYPGTFRAIDCYNSSGMKPIRDVHESILDIIAAATNL